MTTKDILRELNHFLFNNRSSGTTTLIKKISDENDVHILVHNEETKQNFGKNAINIQDLYENKGLPPKPILVDNATFIELIKMVVNNISYLEQKIISRDNVLKQIKDSINFLEKRNL